LLIAKAIWGGDERLFSFAGVTRMDIPLEKRAFLVKTINIGEFLGGFNYFKKQTENI